MPLNISLKKIFYPTLLVVLTGKADLIQVSLLYVKVEAVFALPDIETYYEAIVTVVV